jgi:N-acetylmuramoyl-L-alanine amidase
MKIVMSSGHGKYIRGAADILDEVDEARKVVNKTAELLKSAGVDITVFHDNTSHTQSENLNAIVNFHNSKTRDLDVSVHFNAYQHTSKPMGTECLYVTQEELADDVSRAIATAGGFIDRGPKYRSDLKFLNSTEMPAILIETCFVDSSADAALYRQNFDIICNAIADAVVGEDIEPGPSPEPPEPEPVPPGALFHVKGRCSSFGGPDDDGVSSSEGLAFIYEYDAAPHLFLPKQPSGTTGLARRLNPNVYYVACRWNYNVTPKNQLAKPSYQALVMAGGMKVRAWPADWGPHEDTGRVADLSPGLLELLELNTDDEVEVIYPAPE